MKNPDSVPIVQIAQAETKYIQTPTLCRGFSLTGLLNKECIIIVDCLEVNRELELSDFVK